MSYDLAVWRAARTLSEEEAQEVYERLCDPSSYVSAEVLGVGEADGLRVDVGAALPLTETTDVETFYRALTRRYRELDLTPESELDECPWSAALDRSDRHVGMPVSYSFVADLVPLIGQLARDHDLDLYDPQREKLYSARDPATIWPAPARADNPRVKRGEAAKRLSEGLARTLAALGYSPVQGCAWFPVEFSCPIDEDIEVRSSLSISAGCAEIHVSVQSRSVMELFREVAPHPPKRWKMLRTYSSQLAHIYYRGEGQPAWMHRYGVHLSSSLALGSARGGYRGLFRHSVSHEQCIEEALLELGMNIPRFVPPAIATLASLEKLDAHHNDDAHDWIAWGDHVPFIATILARLAQRSDFERCALQNRAKVAKLPPEWTKINVHYRRSSPQEDYDRLLDLLDEL